MASAECESVTGSGDRAPEAETVSAFGCAAEAAKIRLIFCIYNVTDQLVPSALYNSTVGQKLET